MEFNRSRRDPDTPWLDAEAMAVLAVAYRVRPATVEDLARLLDPQVARQLTDTLRTLDEAGLVSCATPADPAAALTLTSPYAGFVAISEARMRAMAADTQSMVAAMQALPTLIREWDLGEAPDDQPWPLAATVVHGGGDRFRQVWRDHLVQENPREPAWMLPDVTHGAALADASSGLGFHAPAARFLIRPTQASTPDAHRLISCVDECGGQIRLLDDLPSLLYVNSAGPSCATPVNWGEDAPASLLFMRTPPVVDALSLLFETLWQRAKPYHDEPLAWAAILDLLADGLSDGQIATSLGVDVRTVRRRVSDAMDYYGTSSRFTLGAAWATNRP
jgi:hypothetical protein